MVSRRERGDGVVLLLQSAGHERLTTGRHVPHPSRRLLQADRPAAGQSARRPPGHLPDVQSAARASPRARRQRQGAAREDERNVRQGRRLPADHRSAASIACLVHTHAHTVYARYFGSVNVHGYFI